MLALMTMIMVKLQENSLVFVKCHNDGVLPETTNKILVEDIYQNSAFEIKQNTLYNIAGYNITSIRKRLSACDQCIAITGTKTVDKCSILLISVNPETFSQKQRINFNSILLHYILK